MAAPYDVWDPRVGSGVSFILSSGTAAMAHGQPPDRFGERIVGTAQPPDIGRRHAWAPSMAKDVRKLCRHSAAGVQRG
jgi:cytochrome c5